MRTKSLLALSLAWAFLCVWTCLAWAECRTCGSSDALCGPQSLLLVCRNLGVEANLDELAGFSGLDQRAGTTLLGLKKAAEAKGLHAVGMKISAEELAKLACAFITQF